MLGFLLGSAIGVLLALGLPKVKLAYATSRRGCMSNLNGIGKAIMIYVNDSDDEVFPPDIAAIIRMQIPSKLFFCPSAGPLPDMDRGNIEELAVAMNDLSDYIYVPLSLSDDPWYVDDGSALILAFELPSNHGQRLAHVLDWNCSVTKMHDMEELMGLLNGTNRRMAADRDPDR